MRVSLEYKYGRVIPHLELSEDEIRFFRQHNIPEFISYRQIMIGLGDENNPRYLLIDSPCREYFPQRPLTREDLQACASYILEDFRQRLLRVDQPRLQVDMYLDLTEENLEALSLVEFIEPNRTPSPPLVLIGDRVYRLILEDQGTSDLRQELEKEMEEWRDRIRSSYYAQLESIRAEYDRIFSRMRERLENTFILPELDIQQMFREKIVFFSKFGGNLCYGFILPFNLNQTKLKYHSRLYRLKEEFQVIENCYLTLIFDQRGRCLAKWLSRDGLGNDLVEFAHKMPGKDFCPGTYSIPNLNLTSPVIPQIIEIRDHLEEVFETVNAHSFGTSLGARMLRLKELIECGCLEDVVEEEIGSSVWTTEEDE